MVLVTTKTNVINIEMLPTKQNKVFDSKIMSFFNGQQCI